jgi:hypothetical protein
MRWHHYCPEHRRLRVGGGERDVDMPVTGPAAAARRVEFEDHAGAGERRYRRVGNEIAKRSRQSLVQGVVEMPLITEEDHLVAKQRIAYGGHCLRRQLPRQA